VENAAHPLRDNAEYVRRDGQPARERRTSLFYAELGANLCEQVFQLVHFSFEARDVGLHRHLEPSSATRHKRKGWAETVGCLVRPSVMVRNAE
jgi:hypothetical protein